MRTTTSLLLCSLLLAACSGDDPAADPDASPPPPPPDAGETEAEKTPMSCRYMVYILDDYLDDYLDVFEFTYDQIAGHLFAGEALGWLYFPGTEESLAWIHLGPLIEPCSEPLVYDETCFEDEGWCGQVECTGDGAGWKLHARMPAPSELHNWRFDAGEVHTHWTDGTQRLEFTMTSTATGPAGDDWSVEGSGVIDPDRTILDVTIADPLRTGPARLNVEITPTGATGTVTIDGVEVAEIDPSHGGLELHAHAETCLW